MLCCVAKKQKQRWPLRLEDKEMVQKESNSQLVWEFWLFSLSKQEMGIVIPSAIPTFVIRDFITYSCQNWHVSMSTMTFQHASDHSKGNYSYWSKENKATYFWNFLLSKSFLLNSNFKYSIWIYFKKSFQILATIFFHARISVGKIYLFDKGSLSVRRKSIV